MQVDVYLYSQSEPISFVGVINTYERGGFYCVHQGDWQVYKFPILHIFRVVEHFPVPQ